MELSKEIQVILVAAASGAGTAAVQSTVVDTANFEGVMFVGSIATANVGNFVSAQMGVVSGTVTTDLLGTKNVLTVNGDSFMVDISQPRQRFVRVTVTRTVSTAAGEIYAILYGPRIRPTTQGATIRLESFVAPAAGTA